MAPSPPTDTKPTPLPHTYTHTHIMGTNVPPFPLFSPISFLSPHRHKSPPPVSFHWAPFLPTEHLCSFFLLTPMCFLFYHFSHQCSLFPPLSTNAPLPHTFFPFFCLQEIEWNLMYDCLLLVTAHNTNPKTPPAPMSLIYPHWHQYILSFHWYKCSPFLHH